MAYGERNIFPNDLRPRVGIGVDIPLNGETAFRTNYKTKDAIKNNLINYFLTNPGERPGNPSFGAGLRRYIFSQINEGNLDFLREDIQDKIALNFPRVILNSVNVSPDTDNNRVKVAINYSVANTDIHDNLEIDFT